MPAYLSPERRAHASRDLHMSRPATAYPYYIVTAELDTVEEEWETPKWEFQDVAGIGKSIVLFMPMRTSRMTRVHMTKLLLWLPTLRKELRRCEVHENIVAHACHSVLAVRKSIRMRILAQLPVD